MPPSLIPQMSPMNWLLLFLLFSFCLSVISLKISLLND